MRTWTAHARGEAAVRHRAEVHGGAQVAHNGVAVAQQQEVGQLQVLRGEGSPGRVGTD